MSGPVRFPRVVTKEKRAVYVGNFSFGIISKDIAKTKARLPAAPIP
jgi:hypothetical protein